MLAGRGKRCGGGIYRFGRPAPAERSIGGAVKIQGERQGVLDSLHDFGGGPADSAFKTHGWERSESLNVGYRFTIEELKPRQRNFIKPEQLRRCISVVLSKVRHDAVSYRSFQHPSP